MERSCPLLIQLLPLWLFLACAKAGEQTPAPPVDPTRPPSEAGAADAGAPPATKADAETLDLDEPFETSREAPAPRPPDPVNVAACQSFDKGPPEPIAGVTLYTYDAPPISSGRSYRVTLPARQAVHLSFATEAVGEHFLFVSSKASLALFEEEGLNVPVKNLRGTIPECLSWKARHTFDLKMGRFILRLGPDAAAAVDILLTPR